MILSEVKTTLSDLSHVRFQLPDGSYVPAHFHVTEIGEITKSFIDCGGTIRHEKVINFQLWYSDDIDHSLSPSKLLDIIRLSEERLHIGNCEVEVEYQGIETIQKFSLGFEKGVFRLLSKQTDCLAKDKCGIPEQKPRIKLRDLQMNQTQCDPNSGCC